MEKNWRQYERLSTIIDRPTNISNIKLAKELSKRIKKVKEDAKEIEKIAQSPYVLAATQDESILQARKAASTAQKILSQTFTKLNAEGSKSSAFLRPSYLQPPSSSHLGKRSGSTVEHQMVLPQLEIFKARNKMAI